MSALPKPVSLFSHESGGMESPFFYEKRAFEYGFSHIAGVDEAGRGSLAGPVVAAAIIIYHEQIDETVWDAVRDSKKMSPRSREELFPLILDNAMAASIAVVPKEYVEKHNILNASLEAMRQAVSSLDPGPDFILVDGIYPVPIQTPQRCLKKGDMRCKSISAASVLAKVYRDRIMVSYHEQYPLYRFNKNKGYGTWEHLESLKRYGPSPIHRLTFKRVLRP